MFELRNLSRSDIVDQTENVATLTSENLISGHAAMILNWILLTVMCLCIDIFGFGTNIISMICFCKQGFKDPVNVSLFGLAVSDMCSLATLIWTDICYTPAVITADLPFNSIELNYLTSGIPHVTFTRITAWITALITLERCMCITMPLKVKDIITSKRVTVIIIFVFVILISSVAPIYVVNRLDMKFDPRRNTTIIGLIFTEDRKHVEKISFIINNVCVPFSAFVVITICTIILVTQLKINAKWRNKTTIAKQRGIISIRNHKVAKMVVIISTLFIICFIPANIMFIAMAVHPEFAVDGKYINILVVAGSFGLVLESINSSANIFIYYYMSSKFRVIFHQIFSGKFNKSSDVTTAKICR